MAQTSVHKKETTKKVDYIKKKLHKEETRRERNYIRRKLYEKRLHGKKII